MTKQIPDEYIPPRNRFKSEVIVPLNAVTSVSWAIDPTRLIAVSRINKPDNNLIESLIFQYAWVGERSNLGEPGWYLARTVLFWNSHTATQYTRVENLGEVNDLICRANRGSEHYHRVDVDKSTGVISIEELRLSEGEVEKRIANMKRVMNLLGNRILNFTNEEDAAALDAEQPIAGL